MSSPADPRLEIRLLGSPEVLLDGKAVRFRSRKVLALLAFLTVEGGHHRRGKLVDLLWPDSPPGKGAVTLRSTLSRLREALGSHAAALLTDGDTVSLAPNGAFFVDIHRLTQLANSSMAIVDREIDEILRGQFLEGFSVDASPEYDDWTSRWTSWYSSRAHDLLQRSARWATESGQLAKAELRIRRWADLSPYEEGPVALLIEVQARRGARSAALQTYDRFVELLADELAMAPGEQLTNLAARVRSGEYGYSHPAEALQDLAAKAAEEITASRPHMAVVYFDQAVELLDSINVAAADQATSDVFIGRGRALELCHRFEDARRNYEELAHRAADAHNLTWKLRSLLELAKLSATPTELTNPDAAQSLAEQALDLARLLGDRESEAAALWTMQVVAHYSLADEEAALEHGLAALQIARSLEDSPTLPYVLNDLHWVCATTGDLAAAAAFLDEAIDVWDAAGNDAMLSDSLNGAVLLRTLLGDFDGATHAAERGAAVARRTNNVWNQLSVNANLGMMHRETGNYGPGISALQASIDLAKQEMPVARPYFQTTLATLLADIGANDEVLAICDDIEASGHASPPFWRLGESIDMIRIRVALARGTATQDHLDELATIGAQPLGLAHVSFLAPLLEMEAAFATGDCGRVADRAERFVNAATHASVRLGVAEALLHKGRAEATQGSVADAIKTLQQALEEATDLGAHRVIWRIHAALAEVFAAAGQDGDAENSQKAAISGREAVRARVPRGPYRSSFDAVNYA